MTSGQKFETDRFGEKKSIKMCRSMCKKLTSAKAQTICLKIFVPSQCFTVFDVDVDSISILFKLIDSVKQNRSKCVDYSISILFETSIELSLCT